MNRMAFACIDDAAVVLNSINNIEAFVQQIDIIRHSRNNHNRVVTITTICACEQPLLGDIVKHKFACQTIRLPRALTTATAVLTAAQ